MRINNGSCNRDEYEDVMRKWKKKRDKLIVMANKVNAINKAVYELSNRNKSKLSNIKIKEFYESGRSVGHLWCVEILMTLIKILFNT